MAMLNNQRVYIYIYIHGQHLKVRISQIDQIRGPEELCHDESTVGYCLVVTGTMEFLMTFQKQLGMSCHPN